MALAVGQLRKPRPWFLGQDPDTESLTDGVGRQGNGVLILKDYSYLLLLLPANDI